MHLDGLHLSHSARPRDGLPVGRPFELRFAEDNHGGCLDVEPTPPATICDSKTEPCPAAENWSTMVCRAAAGTVGEWSKSLAGSTVATRSRSSLKCEKAMTLRPLSSASRRSRSSRMAFWDLVRCNIVGRTLIPQRPQVEIWGRSVGAEPASCVAARRLGLRLARLPHAAASFCAPDLRGVVLGAGGGDARVEQSDRVYSERVRQGSRCTAWTCPRLPGRGL